MFQFPGACCNSDHVDEETRDLLFVGDRLAELLMEIDDMIPGETDFSTVLSDWSFVRGAWKAKNCPGCSDFRRPAAGPAPIDLAAELQEVRAMLYNLCPLPAAARLDGAPAHYTHDPADRHPAALLHTPHTEEHTLTLANLGGEMITRHPQDQIEDALALFRPLPLPSPIRLRLEEAEDSEELTV